MSVLGKVVAFIAAERGVNETARLFQRLLAGVAAMLGLAVVIAMLSGAVLIGASYALYETLIYHQWTPLHAGLLLAGIAVLLIGVLVYYLLNAFRRLRVLPTRMAERPSLPIGDRLNRIGQAFLDGLQNK